ncbi:uncharacterized protein LOC132630355 [Lycium barbarum]|uniref:uncharacterized protein LOC132630355 n=1 Tax=Lycium barbarum TaxID=112863 RepID=UPI00293EAF96|nr:uncharacterized protein LOC132630355 [Lycium barbarum]
MKGTGDVWNHVVPRDCSWYWKKLNSLKTMMINWYSRGQYKLAPKGEYSVSCSYATMLGTMTKLKEADLIWSSVLLPRQRVVVWLVYKDRLLTKERMTRLHMQVDDSCCCLCDAQVDETHNHLFANCRWITEVRDALSSWCGVQIRKAKAMQVVQWLKSRKWKQFKKELIASVWGAMIYYRWQARNWKVFRSINVNTGFVVTQIQIEIRGRTEWLRNSRKARR